MSLTVLCYKWSSKWGKKSHWHSPMRIIRYFGLQENWISHRNENKTYLVLLVVDCFHIYVTEKKFLMEISQSTNKKTKRWIDNINWLIQNWFIDAFIIKLKNQKLLSFELKKKTFNWCLSHSESGRNRKYRLEMKTGEDMEDISRNVTKAREQ